VVDLNKNVQSLNGGSAGTPGIRYNFLDKPEQINIVGKGVIKIVYSADGEKLQRTFTPTSGTAITTTYINQFVYQATGTGVDSLKYINFEEGRIRVMQAVSLGNGYDALVENGNINLPNNLVGAFDYFVMDYQHNVRMILTEEYHQSSSRCSMETSRSTIEDAIFQGEGNEVEATRVAKPSAWVNTGYNLGSSVSKLSNTFSHNLGPNTLQKVMAGDTVSTTVQYYYASSASGTNSGFASTVIGNIISLLSGSPNVSSLVKGNTSAINTQLSGNTVFVNQVRSSTTTGATPLAHLTVLFFDERFNFISSADGGVAQVPVNSSVTTTGDQLSASIRAPKNGYVYVYVDNQSDQDVYFDNLNVSINAGNILEENHYYAFGLKIAAISSRKFGDSFEGLLKNNYQYQGGFSEMDDDIGWNDFALRNYDPQIGRWIQQDPYDQFASPYVGMGNDPMNGVDEDGGIFGVNTMFLCPNSSVFGAIVEAVFKKIGPLAKQIVTGINIVNNSIRIALNVESREQITGQLSTQGVNKSTTQKQINRQLKTEGVGHKSLDRQGGVSASDVQKREQVAFQKLVNKNWYIIAGSPNGYQNAITGQIKYKTQALGNDELGSSAVFDILTLGAGLLEKKGGGILTESALPRSGTIMKGMGAASRSEMLARKLKLNINSPTTRQVLNSLDDTVESFISQFRKPSIRAEFPGEFLKGTVEEALKSGNTTVRKLLIDTRFVKP